MKKILIFVLCFFSFSASCFASQEWSPVTSCPQAVANTDPTFCTSFHSVAICHCTEKSPTPQLCPGYSLRNIYDIMVATYHSQELACQYQARPGQGGTDYQTCMDDWNCARSGGHNSRGGLCNGTGQACPGA